MDADAAAPLSARALSAGCLTRLGSLLCLLCLLGYGVLWSNLVQQTGGPDSYVRRTHFLVTLAAATLLASGDTGQLYDPAAQETARAVVLAGDSGPVELGPYSDPPFVALALMPFVRADLGPGLLFTVWAVVTTTAAGLCIGLLAGRWPTPDGTPWLLMLAATSFLPLIASLMQGESAVLVLLGWTALTVGLKTGRDGIAGVGGGLVALAPWSLAPLLLVLAITGRWRTLNVLLGLLVTAIVALMPVLGTDWPIGYARAILLPIHPDVTGLAGLVLAVAVLLVVWHPGAHARVTWAPRTNGWDRRWAVTSLLALLLTLPWGPSAAVLALLPAWMMGTHLANGLLARAPALFWGAWLTLGYTLGPMIALFPGAAGWTGGAWLVGAVLGGLWVLGPG
ncbi:MAG TPA: hypothetical protein VM536_17235 [Chloroflexia bacterium]|nr:hypothetical protein [Chloroflexia bacterium]